MVRTHAIRCARADRAGQKGAAAVEFVLVAGLLISLLFAIVDMSLLLSANLALSQAAREGARRAAIEGGGSESVIGVTAAQARAGRLDPERMTIEIRPRSAVYGTTIYVDLEYEYRFFTPFMRGLGGDPFPIQARVITRSERLDPRDGQ